MAQKEMGISITVADVGCVRLSLAVLLAQNYKAAVITMTEVKVDKLNVLLC